MPGIIAVVWCVLLCLFTALPAFAQKQPPPKKPSSPKTVVLLVSNLSLSDLDNALPYTQELTRIGGVALMNTVVAGKVTESAAYLSVGAGERMAAPENFTGTPDELRAIQPTKGRVPLVGGLGEALKVAGKSVAVSDSPLARLVAMDVQGYIAHRVTKKEQSDAHLLRVACRKYDLTVLVAKDKAEFERFAHWLKPLAEQANTPMNLIVACPFPPRNAKGDFSRLGFLIYVPATRQGYPPSQKLSSATTRTAGLTASIDLAPTILDSLQVPPTVQSQGHVLSAEPMYNRDEPLDRLAALDNQAFATAQATIPVLLGYGIWTVVTCLVCVAGVWFGWSQAASALRFCLLLCAATPVALLPVGVIAPRSVFWYGATIVIFSVLFASFALTVGRRIKVPPMHLLLVAIAFIVAEDALLFGSPLVARSVLSGYYLAGIRFYGIGNEYMGLAVGAALVVMVSPMLRFALTPLMILAIGLPWCGADAGGALTATVAFTVAHLSLRAGRVTWWHVVLGLVAGVAVTAGVVFLDRMQPGDTQTHIGNAVAVGQARGFAPIWDIVERKVRMNVRLTTTPYMLASLVGLIPVWLALTRGSIAERVKTTLDKHPQIRRFTLPGLACGVVTGLVFNDSGSVAAILMLAPITVFLLDALLEDAETGQLAVI